MLGPDARESQSIQSESVLIQVSEVGALTFLRAVVRDAAKLGDAAFQSATRCVYGALLEQLRERQALSYRFWNYVPAIGRRAAGGFTRYEVFSAGRFDAYRDWYQIDQFGKRLGASSSVGHRGEDLIVHVLAGDQRGTPIENPRQRPAYTYSRRYGPRPPSFSRALLLELQIDGSAGPRTAIISGTASIVGEDSQHPGDLHGQLGEMRANLATLSASICGERRPWSERDGLDEEAASLALSRYRELRVYLVRETDAGFVRDAFCDTFPALRRLEIVAADLCRPELRVEVEGILCCDE